MGTPCSRPHLGRRPHLASGRGRGRTPPRCGGERLPSRSDFQTRRFPPVTGQRAPRASGVVYNHGDMRSTSPPKVFLIETGVCQPFQRQSSYVRVGVHGHTCTHTATRARLHVHTPTHARRHVHTRTYTHTCSFYGRGSFSYSPKAQGPASRVRLGLSPFFRGT